MDSRNDGKGNTLPPGMVYRDPVYYVKRMIRGRVVKRSTGKRDFKSALRRYHEIMKQLNDGESGWASKAPSFDTYFQKDYRPAYTLLKTPQPNGEYRDDDLVKSFSAMHGARPIDAITTTMCQTWANKRRRETYTRAPGPNATQFPISEGTVTKEIQFLQAVFTRAVNDGYVVKNPWKGVGREAYATKERVVSYDEQARLLEVLSPRWQRWVLFMMGTGLRLNEARNISPAKDIDFPKRTVEVTRKSRGRKKKVQKVPFIDPYLLDILQEQLSEEGQLWPQTETLFRAILNRAATKVGIPHLNPHSLRHTFATRYLQGGGDIYVLSKILGHSSVKTTEKVYAHLLSDDLALRSQHVKLGLRPAESAKVIQFPGGAVQ